MTKDTAKDFPFPTADHHDAKDAAVEAVEQEPSEEAIDQGVEESFPASDPVSVSVTKVERKNDDDDDAVQDKAESI